MLRIEDLVTVKHSKRAKRVALRLDPSSHCINLVVPPRMSVKRAMDFARNHEDWVIKTLEELAPAIPFTDGTVISVFGDTVTIDIDIDNTIKRTRLTQHDDRLHVLTYMDDPTNRITTHLKKIAHAGLADMASEKAEKISKTISDVTIRDTKSRWGSCSHDGKITFSWRLIFAPYYAADYVVAHEVAHLNHMDHSPEFWGLCEFLRLDYKKGKRWMKENGSKLMRYGAKAH